MNKNEREQLKTIIKKQIHECREEIEQLKELTKPIAPDKAIGRLSRMDAINNKAVNDSALRENRKKLQKLERALERTDSNDFGICSKCGSEIPFGRLEFMPYTTRCVSCAAR